MSEEIVPRLADVGARFGLHPSLVPFEKVGEIHMFEPDPEEAKRLAAVYAKRAQNLTVYPLALSNRPGELKLKLRRHRALSSFYDFNAEMFGNMDYMREEIEAEQEVSVEVSTLDAFFEGRPIDILKLDTEGAEYDILQGAIGQLRDNVLILRCEVTFCEVLPGRPMFGDINRMVTEQSFKLLNMDYTGQGVARSAFTKGQRFGQLLSTDATWMVSDEVLFGRRTAQAPRNSLVLAHYLFHNYATDVAVWLLTRCLKDNREAFSPYRGTALGRAVQQDVAKLIKDLSYVPGSRYEELAVIYGQVFGEEFPPLYEYYYHFS